MQINHLAIVLVLLAFTSCQKYGFDNELQEDFLIGKWIIIDENRPYVSHTITLEKNGKIVEYIYNYDEIGSKGSEFKGRSNYQDSTLVIERQYISGLKRELYHRKFRVIIPPTMIDTNLLTLSGSTHEGMIMESNSKTELWVKD